MRASRKPAPLLAAVLAAALAALAAPARADEGGVSFWLPGQYASDAAVPPPPGFYLGGDTYVYSGDAGHERSFPIGGSIVADVDGDLVAQLVTALYAPEGKVLGGGQLALSMTGMYAWNSVSGDIRVARPNGDELTGRRDDSVWGFGDLYPLASVTWNKGVNNWMAYLTGDLPVGAYDPDRLANIGLGHAAVDGGGAYTYLDPKSGREFSATAGLTYNFENPQTDYKSGVDFHLDWAASQFLNQQVYVGLAGYWYQQLTDDSGSGDRVGAFKSSVAAVGPEVGYLFSVNGRQAALNARAYWEFAAEHRLEGWAGFLTLSVPLSGPRPKAAAGG
ncbi:transporter [Caulobacter sp. 17J80-11]|uniref:SphA family protein n=1 Tax=Caulobacter sp. 17J80-11 TaxID=2763502 RepID=UPI0016535CB2|nr:transporter [Caulobacter sp. 17J80-11]MBC6982145.1 transporter [Caulobacter sp. 17J80-11]